MPASASAEEVRNNTRAELVNRGFDTADVTLTGDTLQTTVCSTVGRALREQVFQTMDLIARQAEKARDSVNTAQLQVVSCARPEVILYRASVPMEALIRYVDSGLTNKREYRASWTLN